MAIWLYDSIAVARSGCLGYMTMPLLWLIKPAAMACRLLPELWHGMACSMAWYIAWYIACLYGMVYVCLHRRVQARWLAASYQNYGMAWTALWHGIEHGR